MQAKIYVAEGKDKKKMEERKPRGKKACTIIRNKRKNEQKGHL